MKKDTIIFNIILLFIAGFFVIGLLWVYKNKDSVGPPPSDEESVTYSYQDFKDGDIEKKIKQADKEIEATEPEEEKIIEPDAEGSDTNSTKAYNELQGTHDDVIINLNVPYTSQAPERNWEQPWQDACEESSLLMLDAYYKGYALNPELAKKEMQAIIDVETEKGWVGSIPAEHVAQIYTEYFGSDFTPRLVEDPTVEQLKEFVRSGKPVLVLAHGKTLPNKWYSNGGPEYHAFIIRGYTETEFITNDPGVNRGTNFAFSYESVMDSIHDWNNGDVENGRAVVLILE